MKLLKIKDKIFAFIKKKINKKLDNFVYKKTEIFNLLLNQQQHQSHKKCKVIAKYFIFFICSFIKNDVIIFFIYNIKNHSFLKIYLYEGDIHSKKLQFIIKVKSSSGT